MYFPDTCIFVTSTLRQEKYYKKAHKLIIKNQNFWVTSSIVYNELVEIVNRRIKMYKNILELIRKYQSNEIKLSKETIWKQYFKSVLTSQHRTKNDEFHLQNLFNYVIEKAKLNTKKVYDKNDIDSLRREIHPIIRKIIINSTWIVNKFNNPIFYKDHVCQQFYKDSICRKMKQRLYSIEEGSKHKEDLKIVMDAVIYSENFVEAVKILTIDHFLLDNEIEKEINQIVAQTHPEAIINIKHLKYYV